MLNPYNIGITLLFFVYLKNIANNYYNNYLKKNIILANINRIYYYNENNIFY